MPLQSVTASRSQPWMNSWTSCTESLSSPNWTRAWVIIRSRSRAKTRWKPTLEHIWDTSSSPSYISDCPTLRPHSNLPWTNCFSRYCRNISSSSSTIYWSTATLGNLTLVTWKWYSNSFADIPSSFENWNARSVLRNWDIWVTSFPHQELAQIQKKFTPWRIGQLQRRINRQGVSWHDRLL